MPKKLLCAAFLLLPALFGQNNSSSKASVSPSEWGTKTVQLKYLDPDQLRNVYSGLSYVFQVNRELKTLTVSGPAQFLNEVEQTGKSMDIPPPLPANIEISVYLFTTLAQAPSSLAVPSDLQAIVKTLDSFGGSGLRLADSQTLRVREGQAGDAAFALPGTSGINLTHISLQSASVTTSGKTDLVSLNGLHCWLSSSPAQSSSGNDFTANLDVKKNEAALVAKAGIEKPLAIVVRANVLR